MANRKINELSVRTPSLTDLMIVGDPSTGYSFKATLAALNTLIDSSTSIGDLNGVVITSPTNGQALVYNGTNWVNQSISVPVTSVFGRTGAVVATEGDYSLDLLSDVTLTTPSSNQVLQYNGTAWVNATLTDNGITSLNGLTALSQTFATGSSGTDFAITSTTSTHTFNLPTASAVNRGALSSADWSTFNAKQDAITLTTTGSSGSATLVGATLNIPTYTLSGLGGISGSGTSGQVAYWTGTSSQSGSSTFLFSPTTELDLSQSVTASSAIARGIRLRPTLTAAANNDVLVGLDIAPTYTVGAFTGIVRYGLRFTGTMYQTIPTGASQSRVLAHGSTANIITESFDGNNLSLLNNTGNNALILGNNGRSYFNASGTPSLLVYSTGNVAIQNGGTFTDGGQRLQVTGDVLFKGSGNTSGTTALTVQNSAASTMMSISNDAANATLNITGSNYGMLQVNQTTANRNAYFASVSTGAEFNVGSAITNYSFLNTSGNGLMRINTAPFPTTGGDVVEIPRVATSFAPTSGSASISMLLVRPTINQTGGANGLTIGINVNPILTAAADWRSIQWSNNSGWGLYGAGSANNYLQGNLSIGTTTTTGSYAVRANGSIYAQTNLRFDSQLRDNRDNGIILQSASGVTSNRVLTIGNGTYLSLVVDNANLLLGSATDTGQKLQVTGQAIISSTSSRQLVVSYPGGAEMRLTASATANNFSILDVNGYGLTHGTSWSGINASQTNIRMWTQATNTLIFSLGGQDLNPTVARTRTIIEPVTSSSTLFSPTSGNAIDYVFRTIGNSRFSPTSGNATYTFMSIVPEYNTTGTYSGTVTGFIYNPTLTSLTGATHRAIETVSGDVLFGTTSGSVGIGTTTINASAILQVNSTTKGMLPPRMTNAQMVAIGTPASGLMVYDTTNNKLNVYDGTNWIAVH